MSNLIKCKMCGSMHENEEMYVVNEGTVRQMLVCEDCLSDSSCFFKCVDCGEYYSTDLLWGYYQGGRICEKCSSNYFVCQSCDYVFLRSEINYDEEHDDELCSDCMDRRYSDLDSLIEDYYYKPDPEFYGNSLDNCYLGVELEVDRTDGEHCNRLIYKAAEKLIDNYSSHLYLKHDGSLSRGFEIVTHPCTLDYHSREFGWQEIMEICKDGTLRSHDTSTCGLHIHLSRSFFGDTQEIQDLHISKLLILISKFYDSHLLKFSRRQAPELHWCANPSIDYEENDNEKTIVDKMKQSKSKGRYTAVNILNANTIEFRLFKGTLNFNTFIASIQFIVEISKYAKNTELKSIPTTKWNDVFISTEFKELKNYLKEKELM